MEYAVGDTAGKLGERYGEAGSFCRPLWNSAAAVESNAARR